MEADEELDSLWSFSSAEDSFISKEYSSKNDAKNVKNEKMLNINNGMVSEDKMTVDLNKNEKNKNEVVLRKGDLSLEKACELVKKVFSAAAEREISIGKDDNVCIYIFMYIYVCICICMYI
jgi:exoribonuclease R